MNIMETLRGELRDHPDFDRMSFSSAGTHYRGEKAVAVTVRILESRTDTERVYSQIVGTFTTEDKDSFGGVQFTSRKDIPALMASKVRSVLAGTSEV